MNEFRQRLLDDFQRDFPLVPAPFAEIARELGTDERTVLESLRCLQGEGVVSRVGPVFRPHTIGTSMLAAMAVPSARLDEVAATVSSFAEVNHNYEREHALNLWFVATAASRYELDTVLVEIERQTGLSVLRLPMLEDYYIDLGFRMRPGGRQHRARTGHCPVPSAREGLSRGGGHLPELYGVQTNALVETIQCGLPLVHRPFAEIGSLVGVSELEAIRGVAGLLERGVVKRFGVIVRHRQLGYRANAMVVWDVPDACVSLVGRQLAQDGVVTLCYRRTRHLPDWTYNLYCMIHGRDRDTVRRQLACLVDDYGLAEYPNQVLFSGRCFKQRGAVYRRRAADNAAAA